MKLECRFCGKAITDFLAEYREFAAGDYGYSHYQETLMLTFCSRDCVSAWLATEKRDSLPEAKP